MNTKKKYYQTFLFPLFAGALLSLGFEPIAIPGLAILSMAWLFFQLTQVTSFSKSFSLGWLYGIGFFGAGTSWIYISIHSYGQAAPWLAAILTILFCVFMGLYTGLFTSSFFLLFNRGKLWIQSISFSILWVFFEYLRGFLFGGFPWLFVGYIQTQTPMKHLAPIIGVYGLSLLTVLSACLLAITCIYLKEAGPLKKHHKAKNRWIFPAVTLLLLYILPQFLANTHWTKTLGTKIPISVVQGNIAEDEKWLPGAYQKTLTRYVHLTKKISENRHDEVVNKSLDNEKNRIIVWPEGAIPVPYPQAQFFLNELSALIKKSHATLVTGIPYAHKNRAKGYYNAMVVLGNSSGKYFKHYLVPFGEYLPSQIFRDVMEYFKMPVFETPRGGFSQPLLNIEKVLTLPFICYEIAYGDILFNSLPKAKLLITISDDAWFGHSMARAQHLQIAQMRSLQSGRYQIVATNNGISAVIDAEGKVINTIPSFQTRVLNGYVTAMSGSTPWAKIGDNWILLGLGILLIGLYLYSHLIATTSGNCYEN